MNIFVLALTGVVAAQSGSLAGASKAFDDAQLHHNRQIIESFLAPDFQYVTRKGQRKSRADFIAATTASGEVLQPFVVSDHRVLALGSNGGVASGDVTVKGLEDGKPVSDHFRFVDVFSKRLGKWVVVYTQVTAI